MHAWRNSVLLGGLAALVSVASCERRELSDNPAGDTPAVQSTTTQQPETKDSPQPTAGMQYSIANVAVCQPAAEAGAALERAASLADADGDGTVSKSEATDLTNFIVGGAFFRADANADGTITPEEGRDLRREFLDRNPGLEALLSTARRSGQKPFAMLATLADVEYGKALTVAEAREAARGLVADVFAFADGDKNGAIAADEVRATTMAAAQALGRMAFNAADRDRSGTLAKAELRFLTEAPAERAFDLSDVDRSGELSMEEARAALERLSRWVGMPLPQSDQPKAM